MDQEYKDKALIRKYIDQHCSAEELVALKQLMLTQGAQQLFDEVLSERWTGLEPTADLDQPELQIKLQQFYKHLGTTEEQIVLEAYTMHHNIKKLKARNYLRYAAVWAIALLSIAIYSISQFKKTPGRVQIAMREIHNPNGQRSKIMLPDSSYVYLGAGSTLTFPEKFAATSRALKLEGEAFFEVTRHPQKPFIVHTGAIQTRVLGTSFKIKAYKDQPLTVAVATGKVRVDEYMKHKSRALAILTPGQTVTYAKGTVRTADLSPEDISSWKSARLVFYNQSLKEITTELERWYNVKVSYQHIEKAREKISVVLQADVPLNKILKVLSATGHFKYQINTRNVTIN